MEGGRSSCRRAAAHRRAVGDPAQTPAAHGRPSGREGWDRPLLGAIRCRSGDAGQTSVTFPITTAAVTSDSQVNVIASHNVSDQLADSVTSNAIDVTP